MKTIALLTTTLLALSACCEAPADNEVIINATLDRQNHTVSVYGAENCKEAKDYAIDALRRADLSADAVAYSNIELTTCVWGNPDKASINMTHLDGWHFNK